jgi:hypothetical protein
MIGLGSDEAKQAMANMGARYVWVRDQSFN